MRSAELLVIALFAAACSTTASDDKAVTTASTPAEAASTTDARVGELQVLVGELLDRVEVLNARISKLENQTPARSERVEVPPPPPPATSTRPAPPPPARPTPSRAMAGAELAETYRSALELYGKGRIDDARKQFQAVFDSDPAGDLADNALYWIGESYFVTGKYNEAVKYYTRIIQDYGDQNKAPDAMLKIGMAETKLGDLTLAKKTFEDLIAKYPYATAATAAKYELKRIKY